MKHIVLFALIFAACSQETIHECIDSEKTLDSDCNVTKSAMLGPVIEMATPTAIAVSESGTSSIAVTFKEAVSTTLTAGSGGIVLQQSEGVSCTAAFSDVTLAGGTITLSACKGNGTVEARVVAGVLTNSDGYSNVESAPSSAVTVDNTAPTLVSLSPDSGSNAEMPTELVATFSEPVNEPAKDTVIASSTCTSGPTVSGASADETGKVWTLALDVSGCDSNQTFTAQIDPSGITDKAGNSGSGAVTTKTYSKSATGPTIAIAAPNKTHANSSASVSYKLTFTNVTSTSLTNNPAHYTLTATGSASCTATVSSVTTSGAVMTFTNCTGDGTMKFAVAAGVLEDAAGNKNAASAASATFVVDNTGPALVSSVPAHCATVPEENPDLVLTFSAAITALEASDITFTTNCFDNLEVGTITSNTDKTIWTITTVGHCYGESFTWAFAPGSVSDQAGNPATGSAVNNEVLAGPSCLAPETLVVTPDGQKQIIDVLPNDLVLSRNIERGEDEFAVVKQRTTHSAQALTTVRFAEASLTGVPQHQMFTTDGKMTMLKDVVAGKSKALTLPGTMSSLASHVETTKAANQTVYDLILAGNQNFYANGILVKSERSTDDLSLMCR